MLKKIIVNLLFLFSLTILMSAQTPDTEKKEKAAKLQENALAFLRETSSEIINLRTPENRIGFHAELAGLMWFHDEREARVMFNAVTNDFRQLLVNLNAQINSIELDENSEIYNIPFMRGAGRQAEIHRKFSKAMSVRQQIASALSEHDALLAYSFFTDTASAITNPKFQEQIKQQDEYFEMSLLQAVAEQDAAKGLEFGRKSLAKGVNNNHLELLKKIYKKNADSGAAFAEEIARKLKSGDDEAEDIYLLNSVLELGIENRDSIKDKPTQKRMFSDSDLRDLADKAARKLLSMPPETISSFSGVIDSIEKFSPNRAAQIRQRIKTAPVANANSNSNLANSQISKAMTEYYEKQQKEQEEQEKAVEELQAIGMGKISDEQRTKMIGEAQKMIEGIDDPTAKIAALSGLSAQVAKAGDKELAMQFMKQAESFVSNTPKNYIDYLHLWTLASGYAQVDAQKSFPILETAVYNLNDTIAAFIKVAEFIDTNGEIIKDGEVQVSGFGGGGITRGLIAGLGVSEPTIRALAEADFARMRNLSNKFDRPEVRILAKMLILRSVFDEKKAETDTELPEVNESKK